jgi:TRAP-type C4-dicarboxylate transport system permease small subunit
MRAHLVVRITEFIGKIVEKLISLIAGLLLIVVFINVCARYGFKIGITWAEEFSMLLFAWVVFLGAYLALRRKSHLALTFIIKRLPVRYAPVSRYIILILVLGFLLAVFIGGSGFVNNTLRLGQKTPLLGISAAWAYASLPVSAALMILEILKALFGREHIISLENC